jgi:FkbM family methyltransferase
MEIRTGWQINCHPICAPSFAVFDEDPQQRAELDQFIANCSAGMQLIDVGAHWGIFVLAALHYGGEGTRVLCIEPSRPASKTLKINIHLNGDDDRVQIVMAAAGSENNYLKMLTTGAGGADFMVTPSEERPDAVLVQQRTINDICRQTRFTPTHIKIDVEGREEEVINGAEEVIKDCRPIIFMELHGDIIRAAGGDPRNLPLRLEQLGYRFTQNDAPLGDRDFEAASWNIRFVCLPNHTPRAR